MYEVQFEAGVHAIYKKKKKGNVTINMNETSQ